MTEAEERAALLTTLTLMGGGVGYDLSARGDALAVWEVWMPQGEAELDVFYMIRAREIASLRWTRAVYQRTRDEARAAAGFPVPLLRELLNHVLTTHDEAPNV